MTLRSMTEEDKADRHRMAMRVRACGETGECPTCVDLSDGEIYRERQNRVFFENDHVICVLEKYPRNLGHSIVIVKEHREDISELLPEELGEVYSTLHQCIAAPKMVLGPEKVYLCSMCDGRRNHLHYQLIPRMPDDSVVGSSVFVNDRKVLEDDGGKLRPLACAMKTCLH